MYIIPLGIAPLSCLIIHIKHFFATVATNLCVLIQGHSCISTYKAIVLLQNLHGCIFKTDLILSRGCSTYANPNQARLFKITSRSLKISFQKNHTFFILKKERKKCQTLEQKDLKIFKALARFTKLNKLHKGHSWERFYLLLTETLFKLIKIVVYQPPSYSWLFMSLNLIGQPPGVHHFLLD